MVLQAISISYIFLGVFGLFYAAWAKTECVHGSAIVIGLFFFALGIGMCELTFRIFSYVESS